MQAIVELNAGTVVRPEEEFSAEAVIRELGWMAEYTREAEGVVANLVQKGWTLERPAFVDDGDGYMDLHLRLTKDYPEGAYEALRTEAKQAGADARGSWGISPDGTGEWEEL